MSDSKLPRYEQAWGEWQPTADRFDHDRSLLLRQLFEHRSEILVRYPWLPLPTKDPSKWTPVASLIIAWDRWAGFHGACCYCDAPALGTSFTGWINRGTLLGVCTACARVVHRPTRGIGGAVNAAQASVRGTPYRFAFTGWGWRFVGVPQALVAVLGELGVDHLPTPRATECKERDAAG